MRNWLKDLREMQIMTQEQVAELLVISQQHYCYIENGKRRPSPEVAQEIAKVLNFEQYGFNWTRFFESDKPETA